MRARTVDLFIMLCGNPDDSALGAETDRALAELDRLLTAPPGD
ncbi:MULTISPECIES: hypothetical protein [Kitasatospora]|nr:MULTISPECIES: hypothetical protein [Kitasatospora]